MLDNADDDRIFFSGKESYERGLLVSFLPQAAHRLILITREIVVRHEIWWGATVI